MVEFRQALHLTPAQESALRQLWTGIRDVQHVLNTYLHHLAAGHSGTLQDAILRAVQSQGVPALPGLPAGQARVPTLTLKALKDEIRAARQQSGWGDALPATAVTWVATEILADWRALGRSQNVQASNLPHAWSADRRAELHLGNGVQPLDEVTLEIAALSPTTDAVVLADVFLLPEPFRAALWHQHAQRLAKEAGRLDAVDRAWLDHGDRDAQREALRLRGRYAAARIMLDGQQLPPAPPKNTPLWQEKTVVRAVPGGGWEVVWSFQVSGQQVRWMHDDTLGLDPGQRNVWAYASANLSGVISRPCGGVWEPPDHGPAGQPLTRPHNERRAQAELRLALYRRMAPAHAQMLALALMHRACAVEDVRWSGFTWRKNNFAQYAVYTGLRASIDWLITLAPLHGVQVLLAPPGHSTATCSRCGRLGSRPRGTTFSCSCGHREPVDINAARNHRQRALAGQGRRP
ncbi:zinc ribbon domain-containing protein [Deinococcus marmoris]|uniref:zinc ribbon domain-containing protein n=1 Tax=Deinococcus marmoris TaxID=249408 RepID=UPI0012DDACE3|nr:zinc ribbon domain-containing protein [Deinococcus marmoris]